MSVLTTATPARDEDVAFFGHPRGLAYLVAMEGLERFSYYGMQAMLVLYMTGALFKPGVFDHVIGLPGLRVVLQSVFGTLTLQALALQLFGLYSGLVYLLPIVGGWVGDRWLGRRRAVIVGLCFMVLGHALMTFATTFLFALAALLTGSAFLKGNVAAQVGGLYADDDPRRDPAFSLFIMASNTGAVLAPLVCGTLGEVCGWSWGFGAAAVVVVAGLLVYLSAGARLPSPPLRRGGGEGAVLVRGDGVRLGVLLVIMLVAAFFWTAQSQIWNAYPLWARDRVDRHMFGFTMPVTWFQSVDSLGAVAFAPLVLMLWAAQRRAGREPGDLAKLAGGSIGFAASVALLAVGDALAGTGQVPVAWAFAYHLLSAVAWLYFAPVVIALIARTAPTGIKATAISVYYVSIFIGTTASGALGRLYGVWSGAAFWSLHAGFALVGGLIILFLIRPVGAVLARLSAPTPDVIDVT